MLRDRDRKCELSSRVRSIAIKRALPLRVIMSTIATRA
jgi:hypothetical protein